MFSDSFHTRQTKFQSQLVSERLRAYQTNQICIIFGQNKADLIKNATFAQLMYNSHYQGYTAPDVPTLVAKTGEKNESET